MDIRVCKGLYGFVRVCMNIRVGMNIRVCMNIRDCCPCRVLAQRPKPEEASL